MIAWYRGCRHARPASIPLNARRWLSKSALEQRLSEPVQSYTSTSHDPYLNLSIEHYLLQRSAPESAILFLYRNRPSIIIGRNQNPWLEVNLALLKASEGRPETEPPGLGVVDLVRRRSGGGTVFHDEGNVNWTVICPSSKFTRDKHAEMVVRALRSRGIDRARVNERHDIVLDQGSRSRESNTDDTHVTPYTQSTIAGSRPLKVSGSAYKLTRNRALHHGTCLLSSPNLNVIPHYLHSPAKPFISARGVESVSSPVGNIVMQEDSFMEAVQEHYTHMYASQQHLQTDEVGEEALEIEDVRKGVDELRSLEWTYLQTPQFTLSNSADDAAIVDIELTVRHGIVTEASFASRKSNKTGEVSVNGIESLKGKRLHEISSWEAVLGSSDVHLNAGELTYTANWLQHMLPPP